MHNPSIKLSICIPTYNRAVYLRQSLESILSSAKGYAERIEIVVSDNASLNDTEPTVAEFQSKYPFIRYHRNNVNTGDRNFFVVASLARGDYIWVFGDDDKVEGGAIGAVLRQIEADHNLIICNHSVWSSDFGRKIRKRFLPFNVDTQLRDHNVLLSRLGPRLGFISSVIIRRDIFLSVPETEWEPLLEYGFAFLYSIYAATQGRCNAYVIASPLVLNRGANSSADKEYWYKAFVTGTSRVFEELQSKGYSRRAIYCAKQIVLRDYVMHDISLRKRNGEDLQSLFNLMLPYYKKHCFFWFVIVPMLFLPRPFIWLGNKVVNAVRD